MKTVTAINEICELLRERLENVPVFDYTLPDGFDKTCLVVRETSFDEYERVGEYCVDIYAPNTTRLVGELIDNSYPDMATIAPLADIVMELCDDLWLPGFSSSIHKRQLIREEGRHCLNICLTIQF